MELLLKTCSRCGLDKPKDRIHFGSKGNVCRTCVTEKMRLWRQANPSKSKAADKRNTERRKGFVVSAKQKLELYHRANGICKYCGTSLDKHAQVDHKIPVSRGGKHEMSNYDLICPLCNGEKNARTEAEYRAFLDRK